MKRIRQKSLFRKASRLTGILAIFLGLASASYGDDARGAQLYNNCLACHGPDGKGNTLLNAPSIAGLSESYLIEQIKKFKTGVRGGVVEDLTGLQMRPMAQTLVTDEDIAAVSAYVAGMESSPQPATLEGDPEKGKIAYATCLACHGPDAKGNELLKSPSLLNQHDWYLFAQLKKFKGGIRGANPQDLTGAQMRPMAMMLADDEAIANVVAYIQSLSEN